MFYSLTKKMVFEKDTGGVFINQLCYPALSEEQKQKIYFMWA